MTTFVFRKSSYSGGEEECVEVATNVPDIVAIRDSKNPGGPILRVTPAAWADFQTALTAFAESSSHECGVGPASTPIPS
ncbi:DUF397 domain-containing protein [Streptomyces sp. 11-1-2]|uniref:DUF397 domain-containing protein n=1 Tax=unclassified Streptomyces TaxID=2593676 RepID=UPI000B8D25AA|nr:DUF397 domain-containing protein [Streptomyces sp. 11-1-2]ASQ97046.1 DUF397 domain-containing protein [Streptomyces sp. 11-1-2]